MTSIWVYLNPLLFGILPYVALIVFFLMTVIRYRSRSFTYSSLSSQFLENRLHFWAVVPFHYGILTVLAGHIMAFLIPRQILLWNSNPLRLFTLEITGLIFGFLTLVGLVASIIRRFTVAKVNRVTSVGDWIVYAMLLFQVVSGVSIALFYPWGSSWFAAIATPYFWSIVELRPLVENIAPMPWLVKLHIINAFLLIGFFPFTRLVHVLVVPNPYLWRKTQVVRWYRRPTGI
ncbi:MAG: respiratory nitrate reductase subunit gamma [Terriglobia bacterium]